MARKSFIEEQLERLRRERERDQEQRPALRLPAPSPLPPPPEKPEENREPERGVAIIDFTI